MRHYGAVSRFFVRSLALCAIVGLVACSRGTGSPVSALPAIGGPANAAMFRPDCTAPSCGKIKHIVIIQQENRSFVNLFAGYPRADAPTSGTMSNGKVVKLIPITMLDGKDVSHIFAAGYNDVNGGKMNRFDKNPTVTTTYDPANNPPVTNVATGKAGTYAYSYVDRAEARPYWTMARQYTIGDRMFAPDFGPSWTAHIALVTSNLRLSPTLAMRDFPVIPGRGFKTGVPMDCEASPKVRVATAQGNGGSWKKGPAGPRPCFTRAQYTSMADLLDAKKVSWRYYAPMVTGPFAALGGLWSPFGAIASVHGGPDWKNNVISPPGQILKDVAAGQLAAVTWVSADWYDSDHAGYPTLLSLAGAKVSMGPSWVAAIVNTIGRSKFWKDTAIVVTWDEWGGFYDDAVPPKTGFSGLGVRVPVLIVSPYARRGSVSHTNYQFGSILKFVEQTFALGSLGPASAGYTDAGSNSVIDSLNFNQVPPAFQPIRAPYPPSCFYTSLPSCLTGVPDLARMGVVPDDDQ